ncbi:hypothetical protein BYT27DRAFT_7251251 [Phlegmacium glaucopus]|nr:hypothetical protein BYT27DRAFT_7264038 [Phlegmacium glaucopus]KAF8813171.1 hypothetical protein BYT27DRAFT_7251251 [Phlegmacium glaucopus]
MGIRAKHQLLVNVQQEESPVPLILKTVMMPCNPDLKGLHPHQQAEVLHQRINVKLVKQQMQWLRPARMKGLLGDTDHMLDSWHGLGPHTVLWCLDELEREASHMQHQIQDIQDDLHLPEDAPHPSVFQPAAQHAEETADLARAINRIEAL